MHESAKKRACLPLSCMDMSQDFEMVVGNLVPVSSLETFPFYAILIETRIEL